MKDTEYISQHRNWFSNFFFGSKYIIWIIGAIGGLILFIVNLLRSVDKMCIRDRNGRLS